MNINFVLNDSVNLRAYAFDFNPLSLELVILFGFWSSSFMQLNIDFSLNFLAVLHRMKAKREKRIFLFLSLHEENSLSTFRVICIQPHSQFYVFCFYFIALTKK